MNPVLKIKNISAISFELNIDCAQIIDINFSVNGEA